MNRLLLEIGHGGMGTVYLALAEGPGGFRKLKVIKRLRVPADGDPAHLRMFLDEARLSARLRHPNIVQTNEIGFDGRHHFIVMEYLEGQPLDAVLRRAKDRGGLPAAIGAFVVGQVLAGLHYAHELKDVGGAPLAIVHRDVSPHNVIATYDGAVKLIDFGVAKAADLVGTTRSGVIKGKLTYMAPEQAARGEVDRRADVFAAGVILWELLTGERMWGRLDEIEILARLRARAVPKPAPRDGIDPELVRVCARALAPRPEDRFATAAEMLAALEACAPRASARELAEIVRAWFADDRRALEAEIEAQLQADDAPPAARSSVDEESPPTQMTVSHASVTRPRRRSRLVAASAALAVLVAASAGLRARPAPAAKAPAPACATSADCSGRAATCRAGVCVPLESEDCRVQAEPADVTNPRTLWLGAMFPRSGSEAAAFGDVSVNALDLARRDFAAVSGGLPGKDGVRPIGLVVCDDAAAPERAARHLVDDVGVPAVIGFRRSKEVIDLASSLFLPRGVLSVASINTSAIITSLPHPPGAPMVLRTTLSTALFAPAVARVVERGWPSRGPMRVAEVRSNNASGIAFADAFFSSLRFNGKSALDNGERFTEIVFEDPGAEERVDVQTIVDRVVRARPDVVTFLDPTYFVPRVLPAIEAAWPKDASRPRYASFGILQGEALGRALAARPDLSSRVLTVEMRASRPANAKFAMRYNELFAPKVTFDTAPGVTYDALYAVAYAAFASGAEHPTGADVARATARLRGGAPLEVGPAKILEALRVLGDGGALALEGAATRLDFDDRGEPTAELALYCIGKGEPPASVESGAFYDPSADAIVGTARCP